MPLASVCNELWPPHHNVPVRALRMKLGVVDVVRKPLDLTAGVIRVKTDRAPANSLEVRAGDGAVFLASGFGLIA